jgi:hypothetical protein
MPPPTITELQKLARKRGKVLRESEDGLMSKAKSQERKLNNYLLNSFIPSLQIDPVTNTFRATSANLKKVNSATGIKRFIKKVVNTFMNDYYVSQFVKVGKRTNNYFNKFNPTAAAAEKINNRGLETLDGFLNNLFDNNQITRSIQNTLRKAVQSRQNVTELKRVVTEQVKGKTKKLGLVSSYHYREGRDQFQEYARGLDDDFSKALKLNYAIYAGDYREGRDQFQEYARGLDDDFSKALKLNYAIYAGGTIEDTREFCLARNGKVFNRETILGWNEKPQNWQGRKENNNILIDMGGYNCRHDFDWISYQLAKRIDKEIEKSIYDK